MPVLPDAGPVSQRTRTRTRGWVLELGLGRARRAILDENIQALLDGQGSIEDDESEAKREDVVAITDLQEVANGTLFDAALVKIWM